MPRKPSQTSRDLLTEAAMAALLAEHCLRLGDPMKAYTIIGSAKWYCQQASRKLLREASAANRMKKAADGKEKAA